MAFHRHRRPFFLGQQSPRREISLLSQCCSSALISNSYHRQVTYSSQHVITHRVAEAFYLARLLLLVVRETSSTVQSALCLCQLKATKIDLASGELGICVGVATCRLAPGEGDRGQEKDPAGASTSLPIFLLDLT